MRSLIWTLLVVAVLSRSCYGGKKIDSLYDYLESLCKFIGDAVDKPLEKIIEETRRWLPSLGPEVDISPEMQKLHHSFLSLHKLASGELCGPEGDSIISILEPLFKRSRTREPTIYNPPKAYHDILDRISQAEQDRARNCKDANLKEFEESEMKLTRVDRQVIESLADYVIGPNQENFRFDGNICGGRFFDCNYVKYYPDAAKVANAARIVIGERVDNSQCSILRPDNEHKPISEQKVFDLYKRYIYYSCRSYLESCEKIMRSIELAGQTDLELKTKGNEFVKYIARYRTCEVVTGETSSVETYKKLKENIEHTLGKTVKTGLKDTLKRMFKGPNDLAKFGVASEE